MNRILVIGASGFLGRHLLALRCQQETTGTFFAHGKQGLLFLDLKNRESINRVVNTTKPDVVIYAAGLTDVDKCEIEKEHARILNTEAIGYIASFPKLRVIYFSTDYVFNGESEGNRETDDPKPINFYGESKLAGERVVLARNPRNVVIRVSGLYDSHGSKRRPDVFEGNESQMLNYDDMAFSNPVHIKDVVEAARKVISSETSGIFHVGGPDVISRYEFQQTLFLHAPGQCPATATAGRNSGRALRPKNSSLFCHRLTSLGWSASSIAKAVRENMPEKKEQEKVSERTYGLLIDCVGGLLTNRTWLPRDEQLEKIDGECGHVINAAGFWAWAATVAGCQEDDIPHIQERIARQYAPNPAIWNLLPGWRRHYRLALVNNGASATFRRWVYKYGLDYVFEVLANSEEMGIRKPCEAFFIAVARQLGVSLQKCILVDDNLENVEAARRCGMRAIQTCAMEQYPLSIHCWQPTKGEACLL